MDSTLRWQKCLADGGEWDMVERTCMVRMEMPEVRPSPLDYQGLGDAAPVVVNEAGGMQSATAGRFDLLPPIAMFELAKVMQHGAEKYAPKNWHKIEVDSHLNHLLQHVFAYLAGDTQDDHLAHALARAAMAVERAKMDEGGGNGSNDS